MRDRFIEGAHSYNVGTPLSAGIPNITGTTQTPDDIDAISGAFYVIGKHGNNGFGNYLITEYKVGFDASRSSAVYGRSSTVQPNALNMNFIIKY